MMGPSTLLLLLTASAYGLLTAIQSEKVCLDWDVVKKTIDSGRVYQYRGFLDETETKEFLDEIDALTESGAFERSGLSNTVKGDQQGFGKRDRSVCAVPWWKNLLGSNDNGNLSPAKRKLEDLRLQLATHLSRPTMQDADLAHECYYSVSMEGSFLPRHMDERHEELKGAKGWLLPSRRSLSWLVYLSDKDWTIDENGGALRTYPIESEHSSGSQHDGNLQIGWLLKTENAEPVYLNSWYTTSKNQDPSNVLYVTKDEQNVVLTKPWSSDALPGVAATDFIKAQKDRLFLDASVAASFVLIEDRGLWDAGEQPDGTIVEDINPERGSLVIFDSVLLPHQVETIKRGHRIALAGWFHEATQAMPGELFLS